MCTGVQRLLQSAGLATATFGSGPAFLIALDTIRPDAVVLDLNMPAMSGLDVLAVMRDMGCSVPVVFISADERGARRAETLRTGGHAFLQKPFDGELLLATLESALEDRTGDRER